MPALFWAGMHRAVPASPLLPFPGDARVPSLYPQPFQSAENGFVTGSWSKPCLFLLCFPEGQEPLTLWVSQQNPPGPAQHQARTKPGCLGREELASSFREPAGMVFCQLLRFQLLHPPWPGGWTLSPRHVKQCQGQVQDLPPPQKVAAGPQQQPSLASCQRRCSRGFLLQQKKCRRIKLGFKSGMWHQRGTAACTQQGNKVFA